VLTETLQIYPPNRKEPELMISQGFLVLDYSSFVGDMWNRGKDTIPGF